jgi:hypothetical protein
VSSPANTPAPSKIRSGAPARDAISRLAVAAIASAPSAIESISFGAAGDVALNTLISPDVLRAYRRDPDAATSSNLVSIADIEIRLGSRASLTSNAAMPPVGAVPHNTFPASSKSFAVCATNAICSIDGGRNTYVPRFSTDTYRYSPTVASAITSADIIRIDVRRNPSGVDSNNVTSWPDAAAPQLEAPATTDTGCAVGREPLNPSLPSFTSANRSTPTAVAVTSSRSPIHAASNVSAWRLSMWIA